MILSVIWMLFSIRLALVSSSSGIRTDPSMFASSYSDCSLTSINTVSGSPSSRRAVSFGVISNDCRFAYSFVFDVL